MQILYRSSFVSAKRQNYAMVQKFVVIIIILKYLETNYRVCHGFRLLFSGPF